MRTTLDIEKPVLNKLKALARRDRRSLSKVASSLLADAMTRRESDHRAQRPTTLLWQSVPMNPKVDLRNKDAVYRILDAS
jgi:hypothetical protein